jgi:cell division protein FtsB
MESLQEQITKNSYELEKLQRENERLKAERKTSKATGMQSFLTSKWTGYGAE